MDAELVGKAIEEMSEDSIVCKWKKTGLINDLSEYECSLVANLLELLAQKTRIAQKEIPIAEAARSNVLLFPMLRRVFGVLKISHAFPFQLYSIEQVCDFFDVALKKYKAEMSVELEQLDGVYDSIDAQVEITGVYAKKIAGEIMTMTFNIK